MRLITWNVNGIRAAERKGFLDWLDKERPDVLCVQETKAHPDQLSPGLLREHGYHVTWASAQKKGYSGVATFSLKPPQEARVGLGLPTFDDEGRLILTRHGDLWLYNGYFPNGQNDHARVPYKLDFYRALRQEISALLEDGQSVIACGDFNTAHTALDLARPKQNKNTTGFLPHERQEFDHWIEAGMVDIFRQLHPEQEGHYTWWSYRQQARQRNVGWRIDYHLISQDLQGRVKDARILKDVMGSDHCPVELTLQEAP
jgi:exodeoxyribonuclease-3